MIRSVALLVSAWIEILLPFRITTHIHVALLVSAWIEIARVWSASARVRCRTPRECVD